MGRRSTSVDSRRHRSESILTNSELKSNLNQRSIRGGFLATGGEVASSLLRIAATAILARLLVPRDFGLLSMVTAISVFAERVKDLGLSDATVQSGQITHDKVSRLFWINLLICVVIAVLLAALAPAIGRFYGEPRLLEISLVIASTFVLSGLVIQHEALLRRQLQFGRLAIIQLGSVAVSLGVAIVLAYRGFGYWALVAREFVRAFCYFVGTWVFCRWRPGSPRSSGDVSSFLRFGKNVTGYNIVRFLSRSLDRILLGRVYGSYWVGMFDNAGKLLEVPVAQIRYPVMSVAFPALSAIQDEEDRFRRYYENASRMIAFLVTPVVVFSLIFADAIVGLLLGPQWEQAVPIFRILAIGALVAPLGQLVGPSLMASGKTKEYFWVGFASALILVACLVIGAWTLGPTGVAWGKSAATFLGIVVSLAVGFRYTAISGRDVLPKLIIDMLVAMVWGAFLVLARFAIGWAIAPGWLFPIFPVAVLFYFGLWAVPLSGRQRLAMYFGYIRRIIRSRSG